MEVIERHAAPATKARASGASAEIAAASCCEGWPTTTPACLPVVKDVVEELFEQRLIQVLYCTETFAVGLNFPCRTVCFDSLTKWDGVTISVPDEPGVLPDGGTGGPAGD